MVILTGAGSLVFFVLYLCTLRRGLRWLDQAVSASLRLEHPPDLHARVSALLFCIEAGGQERTIGRHGKDGHLTSGVGFSLAGPGVRVPTENLRASPTAGREQQRTSGECHLVVLFVLQG